ncbi:FtsL-like putative cell division protein [Prevotella sp. HUN102]|uniref:FtsL-like putative cell division protein n=1 Tax=Prevotella sp. HUN102 TaxID=1392486 RepID=UPI000A7DE4C1|nr:FtsL-like putative cell division protein [Prevotella sp. HUN102]
MIDKKQDYIDEEIAEAKLAADSEVVVEAEVIEEPRPSVVIAEPVSIELTVDRPKKKEESTSGPEQREDEEDSSVRKKEEKLREKEEKERLEREEREAEDKAIRDAIAAQAIEDEQPMSSTFTLKKILAGDLLSTNLLKNNIWLILLASFFIIVYISNRYGIQKNLIEIDKLNNELKDAKYRALSSNSQLTEKSRESHVLEQLKTRKDSVLKMSPRPPYIINVPGE